jgi:hypothetical protein
MDRLPRLMDVAGRRFGGGRPTTNEHEWPRIHAASERGHSCPPVHRDHATVGARTGVQLAPGRPTADGRRWTRIRGGGEPRNTRTPRKTGERNWGVVEKPLARSEETRRLTGFGFRVFRVFRGHLERRAPPAAPQTHYIAREPPLIGVHFLTARCVANCHHAKGCAKGYANAGPHGAQGKRLFRRSAGAPSTAVGLRRPSRSCRPVAHLPGLPPCRLTPPCPRRRPRLRRPASSGSAR